MKSSTTKGLVGFLLTLSTLSASPANATGNLSEFSSANVDLEQRLNRLTETLQNREHQLDLERNPLSSETQRSQDLAQFRNVFRNGGWRNGGSFRNGGWRNGWRNGGSFRNGGWRNGGSFRNGGWRNGWRDGGGFVHFRKR
ncbi:MAG: rSAM-associated Gly-rich repeat protein [Roseofilum sp. SBFL]|uniref:GrrA/OscA1 family cyclophane-containing rSAM-modified RiPP n=1 Tax=unclassified Roseofilum TaxID=2620099 RepID=UPI001B166A1B|nr:MULTISPECIES: GrrA/OscA1 family cyclophane-containing rSAM-modified RiPP [unclassified Roseofilum]MBP0012349.1 rSAM-associated Gly-rich repeat protein [Roseofilum sp. SID3]MBP0022638.1 rSAM-associated Gly-rich repeat protein [Roseofilum sp. SID2]MBP0036663.1 rSAM-associated Gly-rich repeat protein [Roseofilum sp. SID1]MBP0042720.1 rSAM-associated Gly-rich repeat protein [Roseofilum sp. SBFL]